jgi:hypothetical protein
MLPCVMAHGVMDKVPSAHCFGHVQAHQRYPLTICPSMGANIITFAASKLYEATGLGDLDILPIQGYCHVHLGLVQAHQIS